MQSPRSRTRDPATDYAATILSDLGSMLGLASAASDGDCMCRGDGCKGTGTDSCVFGDVKVANGGCGRTEQDEPAMLKAALGCR